MFYKKRLDKTIKYLQNKKVLLLTTSNRWEKETEKPKSNLIAEYIHKNLPQSKIIDVSKLKIYPCEGNVSLNKGNHCGVKESLLKDKSKNPSQCHRCWASLNNKDDELWKISKEILNSEAVLFFTSVRWGQTNSIYQNLIERLTWLENRHSTLGEESILKNIEAGIIIVGHNWRSWNIKIIEKQVLKFYGFKTPRKLSWNWRYTLNPFNESQKSYKKAFPKFKKDFKF
jgi:multimeric flavodoxin WrbA